MSSPFYSTEAKKTKHGRELFVSRTLCAIAWSIVLQCVYVSCILFVMNTNVLHPVLWFKNAYSSITSFGTWFYLIPLGVMTFFQGVLKSKDFIQDDTCIRTRFGTLCVALQLRSLFMMVLNMAFGAMIVLYYSALLDEETNVLTRKCTYIHSKCLNERNLYVITCGIWIGLYTTLKQLVWDVKVLIFPMIQQLKYSQIKIKLSQLVLESFKEAVPPYLYFCLLYWWIGGYLREHLSGFLGVAIDEDSVISVLFWMKPYLMMRCLLFSAIIILLGRTVEMLFQVFLTERCQFPISDSLDGRLTLNEVLASQLPLMRRLGYLDLLYIAQRDPIRQGELFSLSLPGGHPHNWNGVVTEVLKDLETLTSGLNIAVSDINRASNGPLLPSTPIRSSRIQDCRSPIAPSAMSPPQTSPNQLRLRNMSIIQTQDLSSSIVGSPMLYNSNRRDTRRKDEADLITTVKQQVCIGLKWVSRKPGINLLFGEMEDAQARHLLLHSQHLSWGVQALAHLAAASLKRDTYGVVQKDLPAIIRSLIQLKIVLERLPLQYHKRTLRSGSLDIRMKGALTSSVKRSLYILCCAFGQYLTELHLPEDVKQILLNYVTFKEG